MNSGIAFDNAIIKGEIAMNDMPAVQCSIIAQSRAQEMIENRKIILRKH